MEKQDKRNEGEPGIFVINLGFWAEGNDWKLEDIVVSRLRHLVEKMLKLPLVKDRSSISEKLLDDSLAFIEKESQPLVVFVVTDIMAARLEAVRGFVDVLREKAAKKGDVVVYHIVLDMFSDFERFGRVYGGENMGTEYEVFHLHALPCFCNHAAFSSGFNRLAELMTRIMGLDLPVPYFPNYEWEMLLKMTAHINREDFNTNEKRFGAIPKYGFDRNKPSITDGDIKMFHLNIAQLVEKAPKAIESRHYECPHPNCGWQITTVEFLDRESNIIRCQSCKGSINISETTL